MNRFFELLKVDFKLLLREFIVVFFSLAFPIFMILIFGGVYGNEPTPFFGGYGSVDVIVPSYLGVIIAVNGLMSLPLTLVEYRDKKILKRYMATPLKSSYIIFSQFIVNFVLTLLGFILLVIFGKLIFNLRFYGNVILFSLIFVLSTVSIFSIGFLIASLIKDPRSANTIAYIIYFPMLFLSGATMPLETMPKVMKSIAKFLPLTYIVDLFKRSWLNTDIFWLKMNLSYTIDIIVLLVITFICFFISIKTFKWYYD
ncbi:MAG: ABC transporter permease [Caldisericia bacterium]|nr:ABC transporter permease [Caldisericia bacterium]